ncbi:MAG: phosphoribosylanthranilate isomerase [Bacteroidota bacterium]
MKHLKIKVCGMRDPENIAAVEALHPDYLGFIFFAKSKRFIGTRSLPPTTNSTRVGVFVNAEHEEILNQVRRHQLAVVQLHGDESPEYVRMLQQQAPLLRLWKAVGIHAAFDFSGLDAYSAYLEAFVFDTASKQYGGTGTSYDWSILHQYRGETPFWLSGGLGPDSMEALRDFHHPACWGLDLNSRFEKTPGHKDPALLKPFLETIRTQAYELRSK